MIKRILWMGLFILIMALTTTSVYAHAELFRSDPAIGASYRLNRPSEIRLTFTQDVLLEESTVAVLNQDFAPQPLGELQQDPDDPTTIFGALPALPDGTYTVNWQTLSVDGHTIQGSYSFTLAPRLPLIAAIAAPILLIAIGIFLWRSNRTPQATR